MPIVIDTYQDAEDNAKNFFGVTAEPRLKAFKNFGNFSNWYYFPEQSGFAPRKFIGYKNTTLASYEGGPSNGQKEALDKFFTKLPKGRPQFNALLAGLKQQYVGVGFNKKVQGTGGIYVPHNWSDVITDVTQIQKNGKLKATIKESLIQARVGQGKFRRDLMSMWSSSCAVTGCTIPELLRASHIKPWCKSTDTQRLDQNNGLLLEANLDALFDSGLISFEDNGDMSASAQLTGNQKKALGVPGKLRIKLNKKQQKYLGYHRKNVFQSPNKL